ncbi:MAG: tetratricopeptide repeat protein [Candidatus Nitrosopolaris sp.]
MLGRTEESSKCFERSASGYAKGMDLLKLGKYEEALQSLGEVAKLQDIVVHLNAIRLRLPIEIVNLFNTWCVRGVCLAKLERYSKALQAFEESIKLKPDDFTVWKFKGEALACLGRHEEAILSFEMAIKIKPDIAEIWLKKGSSYLDLGKYEDALLSFEEAMRIDPDYADGWSMLGSIYASLGRESDADHCFSKGRKLREDD